MRRRLAVLAFAVCAATQTIGGQVPGPGALPPIERYLEALRTQAGIPGMSAAILQDGEIVWEFGFGYQNIGARIRATPDTPYLIGDLSQTFAAVLLLQCVEQRRMDLDAPLSRYGVTFPEPGVTLRQVMSHTSAGHPGESFLYSPERYAQLTGAMEWCAPQPYRKSIAHRLLDRLAMTDSVPGADLQDPTVVPEDLFTKDDLARYQATLQKLAVPYKVDGKGRAERLDLLPSGITTADGLVSTVRDLAQFDKALDADPPFLLTPDTLNAAWSSFVSPDGTIEPTGLGWFVQSYRGERVVWHFGYVPNAYSSLWIKLPERHTSFILLANSDRLSSPFQLASGDVTRSVFATLFLKRAMCPLAGSC
jgi:CubicO group peptidase (beta-lactamase class C family)